MKKKKHRPAKPSLNETGLHRHIWIEWVIQKGLQGGETTGHMRRRGWLHPINPWGRVQPFTTYVATSCPDLAWSTVEEVLFDSAFKKEQNALITCIAPVEELAFTRAPLQHIFFYSSLSTALLAYNHLLFEADFELLWKFFKGH